MGTIREPGSFLHRGSKQCASQIFVCGLEERSVGCSECQVDIHTEGREVEIKLQEGKMED